MTTFTKYQIESSKTAKYTIGNDSSEGKYGDVTYTVLGLTSEVGEIAGFIKKIYRDRDSLEFTKSDKEHLTKELGDALWYISAIATELELSLDDIASKNIQKLQDRLKRDVIGGSGDNR